MSQNFFKLTDVISVNEEGGKPPCLLCAILDETDFEKVRIIEIENLKEIASIPITSENDKSFIPEINAEGCFTQSSTIKIDIDILISTIYTNPEKISFNLLPETTSKMILEMVNVNMLRKPEIYSLKEEFDGLFKTYIPGQERDLLVPLRNRIGNLCTKYGF